MPWLVILLLAFVGLHFGLLLITQTALLGAIVLMVGLWILWKLKWIILGVIGLEELFGGRGDST